MMSDFAASLRCNQLYKKVVYIHQTRHYFLIANLINRKLLPLLIIKKFVLLPPYLYQLPNKFSTFEGGVIPNTTSNARQRNLA
jgi:hypothetical protein